MGDNELKALLKLLDDTDKDVMPIVEKNLHRRGVDIIPQLERKWESSHDEFTQQRIENIIHEIQFTNVKKKLANWINSENDDLLEGSLIISQYQYPEIKTGTLRRKLDVLCNDLADELCEYITPMEKVKVINHILFKVHKFLSPTFRENMLNPQNAYLGSMFQNRKGNATSLGILYAIVAQKNNLPLYGVNLPRNFILAFMADHKSKRERDVFFYVNPYNKGTVLGKREIDYFLAQNKLTPNKAFYTPCSNKETIKRQLIDILLSYEKLSYSEKIHDIKQLLRLFR